MADTNMADTEPRCIAKHSILLQPFPIIPGRTDRSNGLQSRTVQVNQMRSWNDHSLPKKEMLIDDELAKTVAVDRFLEAERV
jgi:hypothetical protein